LARNHDNVSEYTVFGLSPWRCRLSGEATNTNTIVFGLSPWRCRLSGEATNTDTIVFGLSPLRCRLSGEATNTNTIVFGFNSNPPSTGSIPDEHANFFRLISILIWMRGRRGRDRMVVGFTST
jgi:hypothetical protein